MCIFQFIFVKEPHKLQKRGLFYTMENKEEFFAAFERASKFFREQCEIQNMVLLSTRNQFLGLMMEGFGEVDFFTDRHLPDGFLIYAVDYKPSLELSMN